MVGIRRQRHRSALFACLWHRISTLERRGVMRRKEDYSEDWKRERLRRRVDGESEKRGGWVCNQRSRPVARHNGVGANGLGSFG
jgi:hypothetical protein